MSDILLPNFQHTPTNRLYFGDCLDVMEEYIADNTIDLIYLDPPFNSKRIYNAYIGGAQWVAFDDTWKWYEAVDDFHAVAGDVALAPAMEGLRNILGEGSALAYLSYMARRLRECHRVLKETGSIYLHCDPTFNYLLRVVMDALFGTDNYRNEIVWKRSSGHETRVKQWPTIHDTILMYSKSAEWSWNRLYSDFEDHERQSAFPYRDERGRYATRDMTGGFTSGPQSYEMWHGKTPSNGRAWALPSYQRFPQWLRELMPDENEWKHLGIHAKMDVLHHAGVIHWPSKADGMPRLKYYLADRPGKRIGDTWEDISPLGAHAKERLGYPTQKPLALLRRIMEASSNEGDVILDPFCGCGTTIHAAQDLDRQWIGIDVCPTACQVIYNRLNQHFDSLWSDTELIGIPLLLDDAKSMAANDPFLFETWAASTVKGMSANQKQRGDKGIDGKGRFPIAKGIFLDIVSQIKAGSATRGHIQAFDGARREARADLGVFTCFENNVTEGMRNAAVNFGKYDDRWPVIQIFTIEDYFAGKQPNLPIAI